MTRLKKTLGFIFSRIKYKTWLEWWERHNGEIIAVTLSVEQSVSGMYYRRIPCIREPIALAAMFEAVSFRSHSQACETWTPCSSQSLGVQGRSSEGIFPFPVVGLDKLFPRVWFRTSGNAIHWPPQTVLFRDWFYTAMFYFSIEIVWIW